MPGTSVVAIDSTYEELTRAASVYREQNVYPYLDANGYFVRLLSGSNATRAAAATATATSSVTLITGTGHGTYDAFHGDFNEDVYSIGGYSPQEVSGRIAHFFACDTAKILGPDLVSNGCIAYIGYDELFTYDPTYAQLFFECDATIDIALADGATVAEAINRATQAFQRRIAALLAKPATARAGVALQFNLDHLCSPMKGAAWGDPTAKLVRA